MNRNQKKVIKNVALYFVLTVLAIVAIFPIVFIFFSSFRENTEIFAYAFPFTSKSIFPVEWTMENYHAIFTEFAFGTSMMNTIIIVLVLVPFNIMIAAMAGYAFAFYSFKWKGVLFALFIVSFMIPSDSIALPLYTMINNLGLMNTRWAMILPSVSSGLAMFLFTQFFKGIPASFLEAARIDGANLRQIFFRIVMPLSVPIFITAGLMIFVNEWNNYFWPLLVTRSPSLRTIQVALAFMKDENETYWSYIYAVATISTIVPVMLFLPLQKYFVQGVTSSGIKG